MRVACLAVSTRQRVEVLSTGLPELDGLLQGGIVRGTLAEIVGPASGGKTGLLYALLAQAASRRERMAYVDAFDSLDPGFAARAGVGLERLLWVRCRGSARTAFKATDILVQAGGFGLVVMDLEPAPGGGRRGLLSAPPSTWFRWQRAVAGTPTVLVACGPQARAGSAAGLVLRLERRRSCWCRPPLPASPEDGAAPRARLFQGMECQVELLRGKTHGRVSFYSHC